MVDIEALLAKNANKKTGKIVKLRPDQRARLEAEKAEETSQANAAQASIESLLTPPAAPSVEVKAQTPVEPQIQNVVADAAIKTEEAEPPPKLEAKSPAQVIVPPVEEIIKPEVIKETIEASVKEEVSTVIVKPAPAPVLEVKSSIKEESQAFVAPAQIHEPKKTAIEVKAEQPSVEVFNSPKMAPQVLPDMPETNGHFQIPHDLFQWCQLALKKNQMRVFSCFLRYTLGFRRTQCQASHSFISKYTGIKDHKTIKEVIRDLMALNLVVEAIPYNPKTNQPTTYFVPKVEEILSRSSTLSPKVEAPSGVFSPEGNTPGAQGDKTPSPQREELPPKKDTLNKPLKKTLSHLEKLVEDFIPPKKREEAFENLEFWKKKYSELEITWAVQAVIDHGIIGKPSEKVYDVFAYAFTMMDTLVSKGRVHYMESYLREVDQSISQEERSLIDKNVQTVCVNGWTREDQVVSVIAAYRKANQVPPNTEVPEYVALKSWCAGELNS